MALLHGAKENNQIGASPAPALGFKSSSTLLSISSTGVLFVKNHQAIGNLRPVVIIDFRQMWLPRTSFCTEPIALVQRPEMCKALVRVIDDYLLRNGRSKSSHLTIATIARTLAKFLEYGWINGRYDFSDWRPSDTNELAVQLSEGGWIHALNLRERITQIVSARPYEEWMNVWIPARDHRMAIVPEEFQRVFSTNIATREIYALRGLCASIMCQALPEVASICGEYIERKHSAAWLSAECATINQLSSLSGQQALSFLPYPHPERLAKALASGREERTQTLGPEDLAKILGEAFRWIYRIAPLLEKVVVELASWSQRHAGTNAIRWPVQKKLEKIRSIAVLEAEIGVRVGAIRHRYKKGAITTVDEILAGCYSAVFIVVAAMNARRKDELQHPYFGLFRGCLKVVDEGLGLNICEFYIEKTVKGYVPFFVNNSTRDAIQILTRLSKIAVELAIALRVPGRVPTGQRGIPLFAMPSITQGVALFNFASRSRGGDRLANALLRTSVGEDLKAHMLRRAHALLYHYRFESSSLHALCQQLGHVNIDTTQIYVTDSARTAVERRGAYLYGKLTPAQHKALHVELDDLEKDKSAVGRQKLFTLVADVIAGREQSKIGFAKLVQRFHQTLGKSVSYAHLDAVKQSVVVGSTLASRGYGPHPLWHSTCMAGSARTKAQGRCFNRVSQELEREKAKPSVCGGCVHQHLTTQHIKNMEDEVPRLRQELEAVPPATLIARRISQELQLLETALSLCRKRLSS